MGPMGVAPIAPPCTLPHPVEVTVGTQLQRSRQQHV